jgi:hypothetical protein
LILQIVLVLRVLQVVLPPVGARAIVDPDMIWGLLSLYAPPSAEVAQLVEHVTENHGVGSSILPLGTRKP